MIRARPSQAARGGSAECRSTRLPVRRQGLVVSCSRREQRLKGPQCSDSRASQIFCTYPSVHRDAPVRGRVRRSRDDSHTWPITGRSTESDDSPLSVPARGLFAYTGRRAHPSASPALPTVPRLTRADERPGSGSRVSHPTARCSHPRAQTTAPLARRGALSTAVRKHRIDRVLRSRGHPPSRAPAANGCLPAG